jgi:hypothetical protein
MVAGAVADSPPQLPSHVREVSAAPCQDDYTHELGHCHVFRGMMNGEVHTFIVFARYNGEVVRIEFFRNLELPEVIWTLHGYDTF